MSKGSLMKGTLIMAASGLVIKLIGFIFKIVLARVLKEEGFAIYNISYSVYGPILMLFVSGIPVAISQISAEERGKNGAANTGIFTTMLAFNAFFGFLLAGLFVLAARPLGLLLLGDAQTILPLMGIAPAIFFAAMLAVFRGYYQGLQQMMPTAVSQIVEQIIRVGGGLALVMVLIEAGPGYGAMGVTLAAGAGGFAGWMVLVGYYLRWRKTGFLAKPGGGWIQPGIVKRVLKLAIPVTIGALAISLMQFLDATIIPLRLVSMGFTREQANNFFGGFGMANSLVTFPTILSTAISVNLIPAIAKTSVSAPELTRYRIGQAVRWGGIVSFPASVGLFLLAEPLSILVFATKMAILPLQVLSWSVILISLQGVTTGIIQGLGKTYLPARHLLIGGIFNGIINYLLTPILGIRGAAMGTIGGYLVSLLGNLRDLGQLTGFRQVWRISLPTIFATAGMGLIVYIARYWVGICQLPLVQQVGVTVLAGVVGYFLLLLFLGGITWKEIKSLLLLDRLFGNKR